MRSTFTRDRFAGETDAREAFGPWGGGGRPPFPPMPPGFGHGHGHGRGRGRGGRGTRGGRGNVRIALLALLAERPMHGYEMITELDQRTGGVWRPSPGSVYPTLQLLTDEGLVTGEKSGGRRLYALTDEGRQRVEKSGRRAPWEEVAEGVGPAATQLRGAIGALTAAAGQVMYVGDEDQQARALTIIDEARRKLYGVLAGDAGRDTGADGDAGQGAGD